MERGIHWATILITTSTHLCKPSTALTSVNAMASLDQTSGNEGHVISCGPAFGKNIAFFVTSDFWVLSVSKSGWIQLVSKITVQWFLSSFFLVKQDLPTCVEKKPVHTKWRWYTTLVCSEFCKEEWELDVEAHGDPM